MMQRIAAGLILVMGCAVEADEPTATEVAALDTNPGNADSTFGHYVKCDGGTANVDDDATEIETALNHADNAMVVVASPLCTITRTINVRARRGVHLIGQSKYNTRLRWDSASTTTPMFNLGRVRDSSFGSFAIDVASGRTLAAGFHVHNQCDGGAVCSAHNTGAATTNDLFHDLLITRGAGTLVDGIVVKLPPGFSSTGGDGDGDDKNDHHRFVNVSVDAFTGNGFELEGRNSKAHVFMGTFCESFISGAPAGNACVYTDFQEDIQRGGSFYWFGGTAVGQYNANFVLGFNEAIYISGVYSEKSDALLRVPEDSHRTFPITLSAVQFETGYLGTQGSDTNVIDAYGPGPLVIEGSHFGTGSSAEALQFCWRASTSTGSEVMGAFEFRGNTVVSTTAAASSGTGNPFAPNSACRYPTTQTSNLVCSNCTTSTSNPSYVPMGLHAGTFDLGASKVQSVRKRNTAGYFVDVSSAVGAVNPLCRIEDGTIGQQLALRSVTDWTLVDDNSSTGATSCSGITRNIKLPLVSGTATDYSALVDEVLVLTFHADGYWRKVGRL